MCKDVSTVVYNVSGLRKMNIADETLTDYSFISRYHYTKSKFKKTISNSSLNSHVYLDTLYLNSWKYCHLKSIINISVKIIQNHFEKNPWNIIVSLILCQNFDYYMLLFQHATLKMKGKNLPSCTMVLQIPILRSLFSSVVEHWSRKPGVVSSNLTGGKYFKVHSTEIGFYVISCLRRFFLPKFNSSRV